MGEGRGTTESGQCVILRRLRKTRRPPARFASDEDLKIEGRRRMAERRMPIAPSATLFSIRPSLCLRTARRGVRPGQEEGGLCHFASWRDSGLSIVRKCELEMLEREGENRQMCTDDIFLYGLILSFAISLRDKFVFSCVVEWRKSIECLTLLHSECN